MLTGGGQPTCRTGLRKRIGRTFVNRCIMSLSLEQALIEVWRQSLVENARAVTLGK